MAVHGSGRTGGRAGGVLQGGTGGCRTWGRGEPRVPQRPGEWLDLRKCVRRGRFHRLVSQ